MIRNLALGLALVGALALAWWAGTPPRPLPDTAPATAFSAARAMVDDRVIARVPHPIGTSANAAARDYIVQRMTELGLQPQVQKTFAFSRTKRLSDPFVLGGQVENIVGVLPGADRATPAVALMAHYDSVPGSPGAADDAAGVAATLEAVRALKAQGTPARDVVVVITDGEEAGLLGAQGFFREHPLARHVGFLINMDTRGGGGRAQMFQTGADNGQVVDLFRRSAANPTSSSLTVFIYEHMPNDTDFTIAKDAGVTGLNYAFIGRQFDYHSPTSTADNLDQASLQHMGEQILAASRAAATAKTLPAKAPNAVYSHLFGNYVLAYPPAMGWAVLAAALALTAIGVWRAQRRAAFTWGDVARGAGAAAYLALTASVLLRMARRGTGAGFGFMEQRSLLAQVGLWEGALLLVGTGATIYAAAASGRGSSRFHAALLAAAAGAACCAFGLDIPGLVIGGAGALVALFTFGKPAGIAGAWTGVLATAFVVAVGAQIAAAPTAFVVAWPLTIAALMGAATAMGSARAPWVSLLLVVPAVATLGWILGFGHGAFQGLDLPELLALICWLGALVVWPLAHGTPEGGDARMGALAAVLLGLGLTAVVHFLPPWSARHPQATTVLFVQDVDGGKAWRVSPTPNLEPWTEAALKADGGAVAKTNLPMVNPFHPVWAAPAKPVTAAAPQMTFMRQADGSLLLTVMPPPNARGLSLNLRSGQKLIDTTVNGRPTALFDQPGQWSVLRFATAPQGVTIGFRSVAGGALEVRWGAETDDWPAEAKPLPPLADKLMAFGDSGSLVAIGARRFTW